MHDQNPRSLINGTKVGDARVASAWDQFYAHCFKIIHECSGVRQLSATDREDCVQEVMMEIVRRFGERQAESPPDEVTGWIRVVSRNKAADIARRHHRRHEILFDDGTGAGVLDAALSAAKGQAETEPGEYVSLVWEALLSLDHEVPVTSYLVFYLHTIEGWPYAEIAELFQISQEDARVRRHRVKNKFGEILKTTDRRRQQEDNRPDASP